MKPKKCPKIAIGTVLERAGILYSVCRQDKEELLLSGIQWEMVEKLPVLLDKCASAQSALTVKREEFERINSELKAYILECRNYRSRFAEEIRLMLKLEKINYTLSGFRTNRYNTSGLIQDLNDLAVLYRKCAPLMNVSSYKRELDDEAVLRSMTLADRYSGYRVGYKSADRELQEVRDMFLSELYEIIQMVCRFGKVAFHDDPHRIKNYHSIK